MTDGERFALLARLFREACGKPRDERAEYVRSRCGSDAALAQEVLSLLAEDGHAGTFLETPAVESARLEEPFEAVRSDLELPLPRTIGPYRVLRLLGTGGMGTVFEAEQDQPRRRVALKRIAAGLVTTERLRRFRREAELLGRLEHPGIARILEAGTTRSEAGELPYLAMELIEGTPITEFVARRSLSSDEVLRLIAAIADAVQHAHDRGVLHRDLKPSNILVDAAGRPRILDFGVAVPLEDDDRTGAPRTLSGQLVGTLPYMSPEQATGPAAALDGRSDVYSLGVLTYRLLAGRAPFDLRDVPVHEALRRVMEDESPPLGAVRPDLDPDVCAIVRMAMEKDRDRRYSSARALKEDIGRYGMDLPVLARPPETLYQLRKFRRRHRALLTGMTAMLVPVAALAVYAFVEARDARAAQRRAEESLAEARAAQRDTDDVIEFVIELFGDRTSVRSQSPRWLRESKARVAKLVGDYMQGHPVSWAYACEVLGNTHDRDGKIDEALPNYRTAIRLYTEQLGEAHPWTLRARRNLAIAQWRGAGDAAAAEAELRAVAAAADRSLGPEHAFSIHALGAHATVLIDLGRLEEADTELQVAAERHARAGASERLGHEIQRAIARLRRRQGHLDESVRLADRLVQDPSWIPFR